MAYLTTHLHLSDNPADDVEVTAEDDYWLLRLRGQSESGLWCYGSAQQLHQLAIAIENAVHAQERRLRERDTARLDGIIPEPAA